MLYRIYYTIYLVFTKNKMKIYYYKYTCCINIKSTIYYINIKYYFFKLKTVTYSLIKKFK